MEFLLLTYPYGLERSFREQTLYTDGQDEVPSFLPVGIVVVVAQARRFGRTAYLRRRKYAAGAVLVYLRPRNYSPGADLGTFGIDSVRRNGEDPTGDH